MKQAVIVGIGEILWDMLPTGGALGGAPANFAYMTDVLGDLGIVASRIGSDRLGRETKEALDHLGLCSSYLQLDDTLETSTSAVSLDAEGQPTFQIKGPVAWDHLQWTPRWKHLAQHTDVVCFGSLAQRSPQSAVTINNFLRTVRRSCLRVLDVNLRESFYTSEILIRSFHQADVVKLNEHELVRVAKLFELPSADDVTLARILIRNFGLQLVCVTRGAHGSLLVSTDEISEHAGVRINVVDAIGAGDAFTACLAHHFIRNRPLKEINDAANRFASWVATQAGATPFVDRHQTLAI